MEEHKRIAAHHATKYISDGMHIGLGTGSTVKYTIDKIGELVDAGLDVVAVPTSVETERRAEALGIPLQELNECRLDLTIDGADQVNPALNVIKGGGGALLREKIVARASEKVVIVVDETKIVDIFDFPLPVEVVSYGWRQTQVAVRKLGLNPCLRNDAITDNGNYILDCSYTTLDNLVELEIELNNIPGVVENGLFINQASEVIVGTSSGAKTIRRN